MKYHHRHGRINVAFGDPIAPAFMGDYISPQEPKRSRSFSRYFVLILCIAMCLMVLSIGVTDHPKPAWRLLLQPALALVILAGGIYEFIKPIGSPLNQPEVEIPNINELKAITWLHPWEAYPDVELEKEGRLKGYDLELVREVGPKHPLFPFKAHAIPIAASRAGDDRLYWIPNKQHPFVEVHLTWAGTREQRSADHPTTVFYNSFEDWQERSMKRDHAFVSRKKVKSDA